MENLEQEKFPLKNDHTPANANSALGTDKGDQDFLTKVSSRANLEPYLQSIFPTMLEEHRALSIVFMDLDHFKRFNDTKGHQFGDEVLKYVGSSLRLTFQDVPCRIFRYGGDEFLFVFPDKSSREAARLVQTLRYNMMHRPLIFKRKFHKVTASFGVANYPADGEELDSVIKKADQALYTSKVLGRNTISLASEIKRRQVLRFTTFVLGLSTFIALGLLILPLLNRPVESILKIFGVKITQDVKELDAVTIKDGSIFTGVIENETYVGLTIATKLKDLPVDMYLDKSMIVDKEYGLRTLSKRHFEDFVRHNPNPHEE